MTIFTVIKYVNKALCDDMSSKRRQYNVEQSPNLYIIKFSMNKQQTPVSSRNKSLLGHHNALLLKNPMPHCACGIWTQICLQLHNHEVTFGKRCTPPFWSPGVVFVYVLVGRLPVEVLGEDTCVVNVLKAERMGLVGSLIQRPHHSP